MASKRTARLPETLSAQLRSAVTESGKSQYRIAKATGISQPAITRFVNGDRSISLETADKLAAYFGMSLTDPKPPEEDG